MATSTSIPIIVQGNTFNLAIPLQIYQVQEGEMVLQDYTPDNTDVVTIQLKGDRRQYTYTPSISGSTAYIALEGNELADNYGVIVTIVKQDGTRLRSFRTDQFFIVESSDDLTTDDIIQGLENNVIYLNSQAFVAGEPGVGVQSIVQTSTSTQSGGTNEVTITLTDGTISKFYIHNGGDMAVVEVSGATPTQTLARNTFYKFTGAVTSLTLTLGSEVSGITNIFAFSFTAGQDAPTITLPQSVTIADAPDIHSGDYVEFNIMNNKAIAKVWSAS